MMKEQQTFREYYAKQSPIPFYVMLVLFTLTNMLRVINFTQPIMVAVAWARLPINAVLLWLCPMYFAFNLITWRLKPWTIAVGLAAIVGVFLAWNTIGKYNEAYCTAVAAMLALLAYRRDYRKILLIFLAAHLITILIGILGLWIGYATPRYKIHTEDYGLSLGLIYPNHLGRFVYMVMTLAWYLWGQKRKILTTVVFWITAVLMYQVVKCKTIALYMLAFPVCWWATEALLRWKREGQLWVHLHRIWNVIMIAMPFICLALTYYLGTQREWIFTTFRKTGLYSLSMRFISAGILFKVYGFPLTGRNIMQEYAPSEIINNRRYEARVIDNSYIYYLICLGIICLIACLVWLSIANWKCVREKDHALLLLAVFMLVYGLIETAVFQFEHNFMWFYPLAMASTMEGGAKEYITLRLKSDKALTVTPEEL